MKTQVKLMLLGLSLIAGGNAHAQYGGRNGGDFIATEVAAYGRAIVLDLKDFAGPAVPQVDISKVENAVKKFTLASSATRPRDSWGVKRDAVTDSKARTITFYQRAWRAASNLERIQMVFHEYMRAAGYIKLDNQYQLTHAFIATFNKRSQTPASISVGNRYSSVYDFATLLGQNHWDCWFLNQSLSIVDRSQFIRFSSETAKSGEVSVVLSQHDGVKVDRLDGTFAGDSLGLFQITNSPSYSLVQLEKIGITQTYMIPNLKAQKVGGCALGSLTTKGKAMSNNGYFDLSPIQCCVSAP